MKQIITGLLLFLGATFSAQVNKGLNVFADEVEYTENDRAYFMRLKSTLFIPDYKAEEFINTQILTHQAYKANAVKTERDDYGFAHTTYQLQYKGITLYKKVIICHSQNGRIATINGDLTKPAPPINSFQLSEKQALNAALKKIAAKKYKWENKEDEAHTKQVLNQPDFTYYPKGTQVVFEKNGKSYYAYEFTIYAEEPLYKANVLVDASNGTVLDEQNLICTVDVPGTALTKYSGTQTLTCDQNGALYTLKETQRGNGIETYNMNNTATYSSTNFTNTSSTWTATGVNQAATDAHWGAEKTYDYYFTQHSRNSIDNAGFKLLSYLHYNTNYANAFWDGARMTYGDGNGTSTYIFTTIDVCGHEISHGLTSNTSNLTYNNESGALNESYSDIFGLLIENYARPTNWNWKMGEQLTANGNGLRNMANPNQFGDPDTYNGTNWYVGTGDNGGVHTNSGVSNYWFYLLSTGGTGVNDIAQSYTVSGIGLTSAGKIAFRALTVYYTPSTNYAMARVLSLQAAKDLFGNCSNEVNQTANAWHAVGIGPAFIPGVIGSNFVAAKTNYCTIPAVVNFNNTTVNGSSYFWNFGDGSTATSTNAVHSYTANGTYSVKLKATGCLSVQDSITKPSYIVVNAPSGATPNGASGCVNTSMTLTATGNNVIKWYPGSNAVTPIATGNTFVTPALSVTTTYYVANTYSNTPAFGGILTNTGGGNLNNAGQWLVFDVSNNSTLNSVVVYASNSGNRTIELRNSFNAVLNTITTSLTTGANTLALNFALVPGTGYQLGLANGSNSNLYRSNSGVVYPYNIAGCVSITGSSAGGGYYYWFYNWKVSEADCASPLIPVTASVITNGQISVSTTSTLFCTTDDLVPLTGSPPGGFFGGSGGVSNGNFNPATGAGTYFVTYFLNGGVGCTGADTTFLQVSECTGLNNLSSQNSDWTIYPNPAKEQIYIQSYSKQPVDLEIVDATGKLLLVRKNISNGEQVDIKNFAKGIYFVQLTNEAVGTKRTFKIMKE